MTHRIMFRLLNATSFDLILTLFFWAIDVDNHHILRPFPFLVRSLNFNFLPNVLTSSHIATIILEIFQLNSCSIMTCPADSAVSGLFSL